MLLYFFKKNILCLMACHNVTVRNLILFIDARLGLDTGTALPGHITTIYLITFVTSPNGKGLLSEMSPER